MKAISTLLKYPSRRGDGDADMRERPFRGFSIHDAGGGGLEQFVRFGRGTVGSAQFAAVRCWASIAAPKGAKIQSGETPDGTMPYYQGAANRAFTESTNKHVDLLNQIAQKRGV